MQIKISASERQTLVRALNVYLQEAERLYPTRDHDEAEINYEHLGNTLALLELLEG